MSRNIFSDEAFAAWLAKKPADWAYDYCDPQGCAVFQYLTAQGLKVTSVTLDDWYGRDYRQHKFPRTWWLATSNRHRDGDRDWTYGGALKRLRKLMKEAA